MQNNILLSVAFIACFGIGVVCGMYAQSQNIAGWWNADSGIGCLNGTKPDKNGCCKGEVYTDLDGKGFACCPTSGGDCFPPIY